MTCNIMETLEHYKSSIEARGYKVYWLGLKGSQGYNLADDESDIDANAILIPRLAQLRKGLSSKFTFETGEVTAHDVYEFARISIKGNPQWVELPHSNYQVGGTLDMFSHLVVNPSALKGMFLEKVHSFDKLYPSREVHVKKFGYDCKQLHHIIRLYHLLERDVKVWRYEGEEREWMMAIKRGTLPGNKEEAFVMRDEYADKIMSIYDQKKLEYKPQTVDYDVLDNIVMNYYIEEHNKKSII